MIGAGPAMSAPPDYIFFSVNGDTTVSSMTQGDEFYWASNCDVGATLNWQIWYDVNGNNVIDTASDVLLNSENITDGNLLNESNPVPDGWSIAMPFQLGAEPGGYIFRATDVVTAVSVQKTLTMVAMPSPPNQVTGRIVIPGYPAPNSFLANRFVIAESDMGYPGAFLALTDANGDYSMNVGAGGTGLDFWVRANNVPGFVSPDAIAVTASGVVAAGDLVYTAATDSVWGYVKDQFGAVIPYETDVGARPQFGGASERGTTTSGGRYAIYFTDADKGDWEIESSSINSPIYLSPLSFPFSHDTLNSFQHDIILTSTDAEIYARITENGGAPTNYYLVNSYSSSLEVWGETVSGIGADNVATLHVSTLDMSGWSIGISTWDEDLPIPPGLILSPVTAEGVAPGDTVDLALVAGLLVGGTITQDPGDDPVDWSNVWIGAGAYNTSADPDGSYHLYTDVGAYYMGVYADGYITNPEQRYVNVTGDTTGLDYTINRTHCRVTGTLTNVTLPLDGSYYGVEARTGTDGTNGYHVWAPVDSATGTYTMYLCDGDWTIIPPCCLPDVNDADSALVTIAEAPSDTTKTVDFVYSTGCCLLRGDVEHSGAINIADLTYLVAVLFQGGPEPPCFEESDVDSSGDRNVSDLTYLVAKLFQGGPDPLPCN